MQLAFDREIERPVGNLNRDEAAGRLAPSVAHINEREERLTGTAAQMDIRRIRKTAEAGSAQLATVCTVAVCRDASSAVG